MRQSEIVEELHRRTRGRLCDRRLVVDYYRIRRKAAFPWPLTELPAVSLQVPFENYPWHIWLSWEVEEWINAVGWAGEFTGDEELRRKCRQAVMDLARWSRHTTGEAPDLPLGHFLRTLVLARRNWRWLGPEAAGEIIGACTRALRQMRTWLERHLTEFRLAGEILAADDPLRLTHNIPLIGTCGLALAAHAAEDVAAVPLMHRIAAFVEARLALVLRGDSEGVCYDGYVLDFVADLLPVMDPSRRHQILRHPGLGAALAMSWQLAAPGMVVNVAKLGDCEPREMSFHASAHAKLAGMVQREFSGAATMDAPTLPHSLWLLARASARWLRSDALAAMHPLPEDAAAAPAEDVSVGPYALTLRTGWTTDDTAVVIEAPRGGTGHLHSDGGSILLARGGAWLLADPGYQQYLPTSEREFTLGARHNAPVINGMAQDARRTTVLAAETDAAGVRRAILDLTDNYPAAAGVRAVRRGVWLLPEGTVAVCDVIDGAARVQYAWHGIAQGSWWAQDNAAVVYYEGTQLWIASPGASIGQAQIVRLKGSRGHQTLLAEFAGDQAKVCWWIFNTGPAPAKCERRGEQWRIGDYCLQAP